MQQTAMTWLVYRLTREQHLDSALLLGITGFAGQIPVLLLGPFAGVYSDRWHRHRIIIATQTLSMLQAFLVWILTIAGVITVWQLVALSLFLGCVNAFDMPTRQAFMTEMLDTSEDLANAIAINSSMVNGARLIGPSIAGLVISIVGEATCFLLNGLSFLGVIAALLAMKIPRRSHDGVPKSVLHGLTEGFRYAFGFPPVRALLLLVALIGLVGMPYAVLMPIFADQVLHGGARTYGLLVGSSGVGALAGSLYLASRRTVLGLGRWIAAMSGLFGIGLIAFSFSTNVPLSMAFLVVMGFAVIVQLAVLQHDPANDRRRTAARPRDEPVYDGLSGHVALGQPGCRQPRIGHRRTAHAADRRDLRAFGGHRLRRAAPGAAQVYPPDLHADGHPAIGRLRSSTGDRTKCSA